MFVCMYFWITDWSLIVVFLLVVTPWVTLLKEAEGAVASNRIGVKFGRRLPASSSSECLQFLIHSSFVLVTLLNLSLPALYANKRFNWEYCKRRLKTQKWLCVANKANILLSSNVNKYVSGPESLHPPVCVLYVGARLCVSYFCWSETAQLSDEKVSSYSRMPSSDINHIIESASCFLDFIRY